MTTNRKLAGLSGIAAVALVLAACAPTAVPSTVTTATPSPSESRAAVPSPPPAPAPAIVWPLTGVDATEASADDLARPALSIKIENTPQARPQQNLDAADVVFEEYVEYGISRFIAVYHSDVPDSVGPIRSMRPMDKNIMGSMAGPLIFSGAQQRFITETVNSGQKVINQDSGDYGFYRSSDKPAPHNLHGRTADFYEQSAGMPAPAEQWAFVEDGGEPSSAAGEEISSIDLRMSSQAHPSWKWDDGASVWERYEDGNAHVTSDGDQMSATNIVVLSVTIKYTSGNAKASVPETLVVGKSGEGYVASGNTHIPIKWSKEGQFDPFVLTTEDGDPVEMLPGKTWVELMPNEGVPAATITFS